MFPGISNQSKSRNAPTYGGLLKPTCFRLADRIDILRFIFESSSESEIQLVKILGKASICLAVHALEAPGSRFVTLQTTIFAQSQAYLKEARRVTKQPRDYGPTAGWCVLQLEPTMGEEDVSPYHSWEFQSNYVGMCSNLRLHRRQRQLELS